MLSDNDSANTWVKKLKKAKQNSFCQNIPNNQSLMDMCGLHRFPALFILYPLWYKPAALRHYL